MKDNFSIQNWKSSHFYNLIEEGYEEMYGQKKPGTMGTKDTLDYVRKLSPNFDKYYAINGKMKAGPFSQKAAKDYIMTVPEFKGGEVVSASEMQKERNEMSLGMDAGVTDDYNGILGAIENLVLNGDTDAPQKVIDMIQDKMQAEWGDAPMTEAMDLKSMFPAVDQGEMDNDFFIDLFDALNNYFEANAEELTNMDAKYLAHLCRQASKVIKGRSGN